MPITMQKMARRAGVSRQAVSAVLNHPDTCRIPDCTQKRIRGIAEQCGFVPNAMARSLKGASAHMIGFVGSVPYFGVQPSLFREMANLFRGREFDITFRVLEHDPVAPTRFIREFEMKGLDGIVVLDTRIEEDAFSVPHITVNNEESWDVGCSRQQSEYLATQHLIGHGRKRIAFLQIVAKRLMERYCGWKDACCDLLGSWDENLALSGEEFGWDFDRLAERLHALKVDGLTVQNDYVGGRVIHELMKRGIRVPDDIAVIGFDGLSFCDFCRVPLSTVIAPVREQAVLAVDLLLKRIQDKAVHVAREPINVEPVLYTTSSCGCPERTPSPFYTMNTFQSIELDRFYNHHEDIARGYKLEPARFSAFVIS